MKIKIIQLLLALSFSNIYALDVLISNDNGIPKTSYSSRANWEETVILSPNGSCNVQEIQVYLAGNTAGKDTLFIVGDASEGSVVPTFWVLPYNTIYSPIIVDYDGKSGWRSFPTPKFHCDGLDRILIQHKLKSNGPWFAVDNNSASQPLKSWLLNPTQTNSLGGPGQYYQADGDYLVRLLVEYDYPYQNISAYPPAPKLSNVTKEVGLLNTDSSTIKATDVSVVDWNNDGFDDLVIGGNFFLNKQDGTFENLTSKIGISVGGTAWADYDNDGDLDFYAINNGAFDVPSQTVLSQDAIYRNDGNNKFTKLKSKDVFLKPYPYPINDSTHNPYSNITATWFDFDNDGWLDLHLANNRVGYNNAQGQYAETYFPDQIWNNEKNGKFKNITKTCGIGDAEASPFDCYGACAGDYNNDGKMDLFVANYRLAKDFLFKNLGNGKFQDVGHETTVEGVPTQDPNYFGHGMGSEWADINNDGYLDISVGNLGHPDWRGSVSNPSLIYINQGPPNYNFKESHNEMGLKFREMNAGMLWLDLDLDGNLDLWHGQIAYNPEGANGEPKRPARIYMNGGKENNYNLIDKTWELGAVVHGAWTANKIDYDNDGDLDIIMASNHEGVLLFKNDLIRKGSYVSFRITGDTTLKVSNDAFGTKFIVYSGTKKIIRTLNGGSSAGSRFSQQSNEVLIGLGDFKTIDSTEVYYPNSTKANFTLKNLRRNNKYIIDSKGDANDFALEAPYIISPEANKIYGYGSINYKVLIPNKPNKTVFKFINQKGILVDSITYSLPIQYNDTLNLGDRLNFVNGFYTVEAYYELNGKRSATAKINFLILGNANPPKNLKPNDKLAELNTTPTLSWTVDSIFAPNYKYIQRFDLSYFNSKTKKLDTIRVEGNSYKILDSLMPGTNFQFYVRTIINDTIYSNWTDSEFLKIKNVPSKINLVSPEANSKDNKVNLTLVWTNPNNEIVNLQISKNFDFTDISHDREGLFGNSFNVFPKLKQALQYFWRVRLLNDVGHGEWSNIRGFYTEGINSVELSNIDEFNIISLSPNPANEEVKVEINIKQSSSIKMSLIDETGNILYSKNIDFEFGFHSITVNTKDYVTGSYILKLENNGFVISKKLQIIK
ncbi:MAG: FG-GAP-like repeat-containing protein [Candidatus Kapabacteria bacterium]|nr:FG-GAP-like repeat-containing protein [Candidatus Kapabacteria bacterium]